MLPSGLVEDVRGPIARCDPGSEDFSAEVETTRSPGESASQDRPSGLLTRRRTHPIFLLMRFGEVRIPVAHVNRIPIGIREMHVIGFRRFNDVADLDTMLAEASREFRNRFVARQDQAD